MFVKKKINFWALAALLSVYAFLCCNINAVAQRADEGVPGRAVKLYHKGLDKALNNDLDRAFELLYKAVDIAPDYITAWGKLAEWHFKREEWDKVELVYEQIMKRSSSPAAQFTGHLKMADLARLQGNFKKAAEYYKLVIDTDAPKSAAPQQAYAERMYNNALFAIEAMKNPVPFNPIRMDSTINSIANAEYLPMLTADEMRLVFTRRFNRGMLSNEDFYTAERASDTSQWNMALSLEEPVNTENNEGAITISPDGRHIYFAAKNRPRAVGGFDIYYMPKRGEAWEGPYNLGEAVNSYTWDSQPSISADGRNLYFASKREGGFGGIDLWMVELQDNGTWSEAINLGATINTPFDEQTPFIHPDNESLYFSSNGHIGMGDADLYMCRRKADGSWGEPQNLGYPINTPANENGLIVNARGDRAYYAKLTETGSFDLHYFDLPKPVRPVYVTYVKGRVTDAKTGKPISANIELVDLANNNTLLQTDSDAENGEFLVTLPAGKNYLYNVNKSGYLFYSDNFSLDNAADKKTYHLNIALEPVYSDKDFSINVGKKVVLKNVFFESNSATLQPNSYTELNKLVELLNSNKRLKLEISGHTDSIGRPAFNQTLSTQRAQSVRSYLVGQGISSTRLIAKGYGSTQPIATNTTAAGRAINRRTEFTVIEE